MSWQQYVALPDTPKAEWVDGEVVMSPPVAPGHADASYGLTTALKQALPGCKVYQEVGVHLPRNRLRVPDVMVLSAPPAGRMADEVPLVVVEILSPGTYATDLLEKGPEYAEAGIGQYWVADPDGRTLEVYQLVADRWELLLRLDETEPMGEVTVGDHGTVPLDLAEILAG